VEGRRPACKLGQRTIARSAGDGPERDLADAQSLGYGGPRRHVAASLQCAKEQACIDEILQRWAGAQYGLPPLTAQGRAVTVEPGGELLLMSDDRGAVEHQPQPLPQRTRDALVPADRPTDQNPRKLGADPPESAGERVRPSDTRQDGLDGEEGSQVREVLGGMRDEDDGEPWVLAAELVQPGDQFGAPLVSVHDEGEGARPGRRLERAPGRSRDGLHSFGHEARGPRLVPAIHAVNDQGGSEETAEVGFPVVLVPLWGVHEAPSVRSSVLPQLVADSTLHATERASTGRYCTMYGVCPASSTPGNARSTLQVTPLDYAFAVRSIDPGPSDGRRGVEAKIRVLECGEMSIGREAWERLFGGARHVELLYDRDGGRIGLRPRRRPTRASLRLRAQGGRRRYVHAVRFLERFGIEEVRGRSLLARWNEREGVVEVEVRPAR